MIRIRFSVREVDAKHRAVRDGRALEMDQTEGDGHDFELASMAMAAVAAGDDTFRRTVCRMMWGPDAWREPNEPATDAT
jgi:hypothetical protein